MFSDEELELLLEVIEHWEQTAFMDYTNAELRKFQGLAAKIDGLLNGEN